MNALGSTQRGDRRLHIFYRHMPLGAVQRSRDPNKARPEWFSYERCFRNLLRTMRSDPAGDRVQLTLMFDGPWNEFLQDFSARYVANQNSGIAFQMLNAGSDKNSSLITFNYINQSSIPSGDIIYVLENDYIHQCGWVSKVFELFDSGIGFDYLSLYDHKDKYFLPMYADLEAKLFHTDTHHWRTAPSSCGSFLCEIERFRFDWDVFQLGLPDYHLYKALKEYKGRILLTPLPGLSSHCMEGYLSPVVDWGAIAASEDSV